MKKQANSYNINADVRKDICNFFDKTDCTKKNTIKKKKYLNYNYKPCILTSAVA